MVTDEMLLVPGILFHPLVVFNVLEDHLAEAVKVRNNGHLAVEQMGHQGTSGRLVVNLGRYVSRRKRGPAMHYAHLSPSLYPIFDHEPFGHWSGDIEHMVAVVFFAHSRLAVTADGQTEILAIC